MSELIQRYRSFSLNGFTVLMLAMVVVPALIWLQSTGDISIYFEYETPPGQIYYVLSKLTGMYAVFLLWLQVVLALAKKTKMGEKLPFQGINFHRNLGMLSFSTLVLHIALFVTAVSIRKAYFAYELLLPNISHGFYAFAMTLGVLAFYGVILVVIAGYIRKRGIQGAKWFHRVSVVALYLTLIHCLLIGTETRYLIMIAIYVFMICTLTVTLYLYFISTKMIKRSLYQSRPDFR